MYRYNYDYQASVEEFLNFKWTLVKYNNCFNLLFHNEFIFNSKLLLSLNLEEAPTSMGLLSGYAGEGMMRLAVVDKINLSWVNLM